MPAHCTFFVLQDSSSGRTALHHAVELGKNPVVEFLLSRGADVNASTYSRNTCLHTATGRCMDDIVQLLLRYGANASITNLEGDAPKVPRKNAQVLLSKSVHGRPIHEMLCTESWRPVGQFTPGATVEIQTGRAGSSRLHYGSACKPALQCTLAIFSNCSPCRVKGNACSNCHAAGSTDDNGSSWKR